MATPSPPVTLYLYGLFALGAIALMLTSLATTHWLDISVKNRDYVHTGLFKTCLVNGPCADLGSGNTTAPVPDYIKVIRGVCITSLILDVCTAIVMGHLYLGLKLKPHSKAHGWIAGGLSGTAGILAITGMAHFLDKVVTPSYSVILQIDWNYGFSVYLAGLSGTGAFCAAIAAFVAVYSLWGLENPLVMHHPQTQPYVPGTVVQVDGGPMAYNGYNNQGPNSNMPQAPILYGYPTGMTTVQNQQGGGFPPAHQPPQYYAKS